MYKIEGIEIYENVDDLVSKGITCAWDYQGSYYVRVKSGDPYDSTIWIVDKKTKNVSDMYFIKFFVEIEEKATPIDPNTLEKSLLN